MKKFVSSVRLAAVLPVLAHTAWSVTEWQLGRGAVTAQISGSSTYDSNIQTASNGDSDLFFSLSPTVSYRRTDSLITSEATIRAGVDRYVNETRFDGENYNGTYSLSMPSSEERSYGFNFRTGYDEGASPDASLNSRVLSKTFSTSLSGNVTLNRVHDLQASANYSQTTRDQGNNQDIFDYGPSYSYRFDSGMTAGASYRHSITQSEAATSSAAPANPSLDQVSDSVALNVTRPLYGDLTGRASLGYRWLDRGDRENTVGLEDSDGYTMSIGLSGQFLPRKYFPKTTGFFNIGYEDSQSPGLNDDSPRRLIGSLSLTWEARDTTSVSLAFSRSQGLTATDETAVDNSVNLSVSQAVGHFVTCNFDVGYTQSEFDDSGFASVNTQRSDDVYTAGIGIAYQINLSWSAGFNYRFVNSQSTLETGSYDRHTVKLSATYVF